MASGTPPDTEALAETRRELHDLAVLSSALLRLSTRVQSRCEALRHRLGDFEPLDEEELNRHVSWVAESAPAVTPGGVRGSRDEEEPAALLAMSLAGEGMTRQQIGDYLRHSFGMQDAEELLQRVMPDQR